MCSPYQYSIQSGPAHSLKEECPRYYTSASWQYSMLKPFSSIVYYLPSSISRLVKVIEFKENEFRLEMTSKVCYEGSSVLRTCKNQSTFIALSTLCRPIYLRAPSRSVSKNAPNQVCVVELLEIVSPARNSALQPKKPLLSNHNYLAREEENVPKALAQYRPKSLSMKAAAPNANHAKREGNPQSTP